jgi:hypothetical protein
MPAVSDLSVYALFEAATGAHIAWRPGWPLSLPPDMFYAPGAVSVTVDLGGDGSLSLIRDGERLSAFPVLISIGNSGEGQPVLLQGRCEYDAQGRITKLSISGTQQASGEEHDVELLQWDEENRPLLVRVFAGDYYFTALEYLPDSVIETWYDRDGKALWVVENDSEGLDYNNEGLVSRIVFPAETLSALYTERGMPRYLEQIPAAPPEPGPDTQAAPLETVSYTYQWDEAGRLVRFSNTASLNCRYEYTLDDKGNWTERREIVMGPLVPQAESGVPERLVPERIVIIKRLIRYEDQN